MAEFYRKIVEWNKIKRVDFGWNTVARPTFMNPELLGHYAKGYFEDLLSTVPEDDHRKSYLYGFEKQVTTHEVNKDQLRRLRNYLDKIDQRRNTDWKSLYPYLVEIIEKENIDNENKTI
jgi:hypothetical protein